MGLAPLGVGLQSGGRTYAASGNALISSRRCRNVGSGAIHMVRYVSRKGHHSAGMAERLPARRKGGSLKVFEQPVAVLRPTEYVDVPGSRYQPK